MKHSTYRILTLALAMTLAGAASVSAQTVNVQKHVVSSASTGVSVSTVNGQTVVSLNGKQIYAGPVKGQVSSRSSNINGVEYAAVHDGDRLLWESVPGAAQKLQAGPGSPAHLDQEEFLRQHQQTVARMKEEQRQFMESHRMTNLNQSGGGGRNGGSAGGSSISRSGSTSIGVKTVNGSTVVTYGGKEFAVGPTQGGISTKSKSVNGTAYAAAYDGERVIWENVPGAAGMLK